jgi:hypothetical protein
MMTRKINNKIKKNNNSNSGGVGGSGLGYY